MEGLAFQEGLPIFFRSLVFPVHSSSCTLFVTAEVYTTSFWRQWGKGFKRTPKLLRFAQESGCMASTQLATKWNEAICSHLVTSSDPIPRVRDDRDDRNDRDGAQGFQVGNVAAEYDGCAHRCGANSCEHTLFLFLCGSNFPEIIRNDVLGGLQIWNMLCILAVV